MTALLENLYLANLYLLLKVKGLLFKKKFFVVNGIRTHTYLNSSLKIDALRR